ncbi:hypothetical protein ACFRNJ_35845 [Streptomyces sp. NPDC056721]|uniref:hypothetical protein n=1 Tax=Streptomyces sp. NPDC056721 TaxID=3345923 RepID=UPI0036CFF56F
MLLDPAPGPDENWTVINGLVTDAGIPYGKTTVNGPGPGWSWMIVYSPWMVGGATPKFQWNVFDAAETARTDMQWLLDNSPRLDLGNAPKEFRTKAKDGNLILTSSSDAVFALYWVEAGQTSPQAGTAFYNSWAVPILSEPPMSRFWKSKLPQILYPMP